MAQQQTSSTTWALIAVACLVLGLAVGYVIFSRPPTAPAGTPAAQESAPAAGSQRVGLLDERHVPARQPRRRGYCRLRRARRRRLTARLLRLRQHRTVVVTGIFLPPFATTGRKRRGEAADDAHGVLKKI